MIPSAWYLQAQRFRRHARQAMKSLFSQADVLIAPATPCSATPIGLQLIAAPFNEQACLRAARALEAMGVTDARVAESAA